MSLGGIISNTVNSAFENSKYTTGLHDFLSKFSDSSGKHINQINPLNTFEVCFKFHPTLGDLKTDTIEKTDTDWYKTLKNSGIQAAKNAMNNVTGGLLASLENDKNGVINAHNGFENSGKYSFMHYLTTSNLLIGGENEFFGAAGNSQKNMPLDLQLGYYIQSIDIPPFKLTEGGKSVSLMGEFPINGQYVQTESFNLVMTILNTKLPICERIFYPWMKEITLPVWSYQTQPYTTATITIDFNKHTDLKYVFCGCRPSQIEAYKANQENDEVTKRSVTFLFDQAYIMSDLTTMSSLKDKLLGAGTTLFNSAAGMINL